MLSARLDHLLTRFSAWHHGPPPGGSLPTRRLATPAGLVRVFDSGSAKPCIVIAPDGPNVIEHYAAVIHQLAPVLRVVCCDLPGFGHSLPAPTYTHSLDEGARVVLAVLDALGIERAALAFTCANGFYALRASQLAPHRIAALILSQTPSMAAMHDWKRCVIPWPLTVPIVGQAAIWFAREKSAHGWYDHALPQNTPRQLFRRLAHHAFAHGGCWCLASVTQGLARANVHSLRGVTTPCTMLWGDQDRSHRHTNPATLRDLVPHAEILRFADCGHFPDLERPERFAALLTERIYAATA